MTADDMRKDRPMSTNMSGERQMDDLGLGAATAAACRHVRANLPIDFIGNQRIEEWVDLLCHYALTAGVPHIAAQVREQGQQAVEAERVRPLVALSDWLDASNAHRDPEAVTWGRLAKLSEECGEVIAAYYGATGQNPRKGITHTMDDVRRELLDVIVTALGAYEHLADVPGGVFAALYEHIVRVAQRAGVMDEGTLA